MKKAIFLTGMAVLVFGLMLGFAACPTDDNNNNNNNNNGTGTVPEWANGFYNYPAGRVDANGGRLTIENKIAGEVLLFDGAVEKEKYLGTINSLGSVRLRMPEEKFYTIVAVDKANYMERRAQASQFNSLTYYSNTQPYTVAVTPSSSWGGGQWIFTNNTNYWVQVKKSDMSQNFAVIAPNAARVAIPIEPGTAYDYFLYFSRELKYEGKTIALVDFTDRTQANTAYTSSSTTPYTTIIQNSTVPTSNINPAVMVINNATQTVRVFRANTQMTNGSPGGDFVVVGGQRQLITGFGISDITTAINFQALAWEFPLYVPESGSMTMAADKVYEITIPASGTASGITVAEADASKYYQ